MCRLIPLHLILLAFWLSSPAIARPVPDRSFGTTQENLGSDTLINGGTRKGSNLFQSFERFDVPDQESVTFANPAGVERIFTRVTGATASQINGTLAVNGPADLLLINPNGISFGADARLQLSGSFLGTTARSIEFEDGTALASSDPQPVLTMSAPIGLGLSGPGEIRLAGNGHNLEVFEFEPLDLFTFPPRTRNPGESETGLRVGPGERFSLISGDITLDSAVILAPEGQVDLVAVREGFVSLEPSVDRSFVQEFGDITLQNLALVDTSGNLGGRIFVDTGSLSLVEGSHLFSRSIKAVAEDGGQISVRASESVEIGNRFGTDPTLLPTTQLQTIVSAITAEAVNGVVISISVEAPSVRLVDGGAIVSLAFESGSGGQIEIETQNLSLEGTTSNLPFENPSLVFSAAAGTSDGSEIAIDAESINLFQGGGIFAISAESAVSGDIIVNSTSVQVSGSVEFLEGFLIGSRINSFNGSSEVNEAGRIEIDTDRLLVLDGGTVDTGTSSPGDAGDISITAEEVVVSGESITSGLGGVDASLPSSIASATAIFPLPIPGVDESLFGNGGSINISSGSLSVSDNGAISVSNLGPSQGGEITLTAGEISIDKARIEANSISDNGGSITIDSSFLLLENSSSISVNSVAGDAGSIVLDSLVIVDPGSQITADSVSGNLGTIDITDEFDVNIEPTVPDFGPPVESRLTAQKCTVEHQGRFVRTFHSERSLAAQWILPKEAEGFEFDAEGNATLTGGNTTLTASCRPQLQQEGLEQRT